MYNEFVLGRASHNFNKPAKHVGKDSVNPQLLNAIYNGRMPSRSLDLYSSGEVRGHQHEKIIYFIINKSTRIAESLL